MEEEPVFLDSLQFETHVNAEQIAFGKNVLHEMIAAFKKENIPVILVYLPNLYH